MKKRVVVTGMGAITPYGIGTENLWNAVVDGKSCIRRITEEDNKLDLRTHTTLIFGMIPQFNLADYMDAKEIKRLDPFIFYAMVAAEGAVNDAGIKELKDEDPYRLGVLVSSAAGGFRTIEVNHEVMVRRGYPKCSPFTIPAMIVNMAAGKLAIKYGFKGLNKAIVSACASGNHSIGDAFRAIQHDEADIILAGGTDAAVCNMGVGGFSAARTLSTRNDEPTKASRPYDKDRDGFVMSEGSGVLVLEEYEHAKKRGAKIYAEIVGYGQTCDAYDMVAPASDGSAAAKAMEFALKDAGIKPEDVDYINAHGTSTGLGDIAESNAIKEVFGDKDGNNKLMVSSTKSMHGHMLGAAGAIEAIICVNAMREGIVPPTINLDNQDERVANLDYVPHVARKAKVNICLSNSFGFGGHNASLVFKSV